MQKKSGGIYKQEIEIERFDKYWREEELTKCEMIELMAHEINSQLGKAGARRRLANKEKEESAF